jgi:hypothetical protein
MFSYFFNAKVRVRGRDGEVYGVIRLTKRVNSDSIYEIGEQLVGDEVEEFYTFTAFNFLHEDDE